MKKLRSLYFKCGSLPDQEKNLLGRDDKYWFSGLSGVFLEKMREN